MAAEHLKSGELEQLIELPPRQVYAIAGRASAKRASVIELVRRVEKRLSGREKPDFAEQSGLHFKRN